MKSLRSLLKEAVIEVLAETGICDSCATKVIVDYGKHGPNFFINYKPVCFSKCNCSQKDLNFVATILQNTAKINEKLKPRVYT